MGREMEKQGATRKTVPKGSRVGVDEGGLAQWLTPREALSPEFDRQVRESKASPFVQLHIFLSKLILNQTKT